MGLKEEVKVLPAKFQRLEDRSNNLGAEVIHLQREFSSEQATKLLLQENSAEMKANIACLEEKLRNLTMEDVTELKGGIVILRNIIEQHEVRCAAKSTEIHDEEEARDDSIQIFYHLHTDLQTRLNQMENGMANFVSVGESKHLHDYVSEVKTEHKILHELCLSFERLAEIVPV